MSARRSLIACATAALTMAALAAPSAIVPASGATVAAVAPSVARTATPTWPKVLGPTGFFAASCVGAAEPCRKQYGDIVTKIQNRLIALKYTSFGVKATGIFDAATGRAIQNFKTREARKGNDIGATPRVGIRTFAALFSATASVGSGGTGGSTSGGGTGGGSGTGTGGGGTPTPQCATFSGKTCRTAATSGRFCPVIGAYLGDGWGVSRGDHSHKGVDLMVRGGTEVRAVETGYIVKAGRQSNGALAITMQGRSGNVWYLGHNSEHFVKAGDFVRGGQVIALSGDTGSPGAFHVHFEWRPASPGTKWYYASPVNPIGVLKAICF